MEALQLLADMGCPDDEPQESKRERQLRYRPACIVICIARAESSQGAEAGPSQRARDIAQKALSDNDHKWDLRSRGFDVDAANAVEELVRHIDEVIRSATDTDRKFLDRNRTAYWDAEFQAVIVDGQGPGPSPGSWFSPTRGREYFDDLGK